MAIPQVPTGLITGGNNGNKAMLTAMEAQVKGILYNDESMMFLKASAVAEQISEIPGAVEAYYRIAERLRWGSKYDVMTGTDKQWTTLRTTSVILDQILVIDWRTEDFDMNRFMSSPISLKANMLSIWAESALRNYLFIQECIFLQGIKDYCIAKSQVIPINMLEMTEDTAKTAFYQIGDKMNELLGNITETEIGTNVSDFIGALGFTPMLQLTKAYLRLNYGQIAADTVASGQLYKQSVFGMFLYKHMFLNKDMVKDTKTGLHLEKTFDLKKVLGVFVHRNAFAQPNSFQKIVNLIDNNTLNQKTLGKALYGITTAIRGWLSFIIMEKMPTADEIKEAQKRCWTNWIKLTPAERQKSPVTFKIADFDDFRISLNDLIYFKNLGKITMTGITPTNDELETAIINAGNRGYEKGKATFSNITSTSATMTGNDKDYIEEIELKFSKK
ncbi:hypothetical protein [Spiroplasma endosymbiont of Zeiraphera isertana]|uniref:hypothetical protein n=1 Tax=Spiroplasma endosymbiont of Zeiraphera isertana TaxID=3066313 RepID=UPI00313F1D57